MDKLLENKVIVVTGGNGLLGSAMIQDIRNKGGIGISADLNINDTEYSIKCDITSLNSIKETVKDIYDKYGRIDGWVNNAYPRTADWGSDFLDIKEESLDKNVKWQLNSYILSCQEVIKVMLKRNSGSIINVASIYGVVGNDFTIYEGTNLNPPAAYTAIKGGLINFTRYLASKYGKDGIRVNTVSPGGIFDNQVKEFVEAYEAKVPLKRMGKPDDIAPSVSFLLSDKAKYITGHNLIIDGGWTSI
ncbi:SDR family oxidoreductase [Gracilimonas amylolytica]|uniref:SDR family oxidoreductase n=1 Tax=Gracilimonas amylolytica TaxID=1749045 RepID=UPI000CD9C9E7|nr:SDR family oxidoreductase [Gracilimonas amylolytica]